MDSETQDYLAWVVIIILGIGYFLWKKYKKQNVEKSTVDPNEGLIQIINSYGNALEVARKNKYLIQDIEELPYPKNVIKSAILHMLDNSLYEEGSKEILISGYVELASFQENVPEEIKTIYSFPENATPQDILESEKLLSHPSYLKYKDELKQIEIELKEKGYLE